MSRIWNGKELQDEYSAMLSDTSTAGKARVLKWMNWILLDIASRYHWPELRKKCKKLLVSGNEEVNLNIDSPGAPTAAIAAGGSLVEDTQYRVLVTFVQSNGLETKAGTYSGTVQATAVNKTISLTSIPTSSEPLVTSRKIYVSKDGGGDGDFGEPLYSQEISDNTTTTASVTSEPTSTIEAPENDPIYTLDGDPFFEASNEIRLRKRSVRQLRRLFEGGFDSGDPFLYAPITKTKLLLYSKPSSALTMSFYAFRRPSKLYATVDSVPDLNPEIEPALRAGLMALGYEYRDRDGQESKRNNYENLISLTISRKGGTGTGSSRVSDVYGDSDGIEV